MKRFLKAIVVVLLLILIVPVVAVVIPIATQAILNSPSVPDWADNLPKKGTEAHDEFNRRVKEKFPVGIEHEELVRALAKDNFKPIWSDGKRGGHAASLKRGTLPCNTDRRITWETNEEGIVLEIKGSFMYTCL